MVWEQSTTEHNYKTECRKRKFDMHTIHFCGSKYYEIYIHYALLVKAHDLVFQAYHFYMINIFNSLSKISVA